MPDKKQEDIVPMHLRLARSLYEYLGRKAEQINKKRAKEPGKPINRQDVIRELVRQDAEKKNS